MRTFLISFLLCLSSSIWSEDLQWATRNNAAMHAELVKWGNSLSNANEDEVIRFSMAFYQMRECYAHMGHTTLAESLYAQVSGDLTEEARKTHKRAYVQHLSQTYSTISDLEWQFESMIESGKPKADEIARMKATIEVLKATRLDLNGPLRQAFDKQIAAERPQGN